MGKPEVIVFTVSVTIKDLENYIASQEGWSYKTDEAKYAFDQVLKAKINEQLSKIDGQLIGLVVLDYELHTYFTGRDPAKCPIPWELETVRLYVNDMKLMATYQ